MKTLWPNEKLLLEQFRLWPQCFQKSVEAGVKTCWYKEKVLIFLEWFEKLSAAYKPVITLLTFLQDLGTLFVHLVHDEYEM